MRITYSWILCFLVFCLGGGIASGQIPAGSAPPAKDGVTPGTTLNTAIDGSVDSNSHVYQWTTSTGYVFNKHFSVDVGIPIVFTSGTTSTGTKTSNSGLGNVFAQLQFVSKNPVLNFGSVLTGALPTGDSSKGLSTGRVTFDWTSQVAREFGRWTPFASAGVANSLFDATYRHRPYVTLGDLAHFEVGTAFDLGRSLTVSASAYDIAPWGTQKVYSKVVTKSGGGGGGSSKHGRVYLDNALTTGGSSIDSDNGFNADLDFNPVKYVDFDLAYTHSVHYQLDTVSFGINFNLTPLVRRHGIVGR